MCILPASVVLVSLLVSISTDVWNFRIYNLLTFPMLILGILYRSQVEEHGFGSSLLGIVVAVAPFLPVYLRGGMGGGDIKLLAGVGAWLGPWVALHVVIVSGLATGGFSLVVRALSDLGFERPEDSPEQNNASVATVLRRPDRRWHAIPFAVMVGIGIIGTALWLQ